MRTRFPLRLAVAAAFLITALVSPCLWAEEQVHIYPLPLGSEDRLTDGPAGTPIEMADGTLLLWVDLHPDMFFEHPTLYVLISRDDARIVPGRWWPELNGKRILYGVPANHTVASPFTLPTSDAERGPEVFFHPLSIDGRDTLNDGPLGRRIPLVGETMLVWVDLMPGWRFVHPTLYVLISGQRSRIRRGEWWPVLNGEAVLYNKPVNYTLISPFVKGSGPQITTADRSRGK